MRSKQREAQALRQHILGRALRTRTLAAALAAVNGGQMGDAIAAQRGERSAVQEERRPPRRKRAQEMMRIHIVLLSIALPLARARPSSFLLLLPWPASRPSTWRTAW
jgi:hypothetical protein